MQSNSKKYIAWASVIVTFFGVFVTGWQVYENLKYNKEIRDDTRVLMKPRLNVDYTVDHDEDHDEESETTKKIWFDLVNNGTGPAIITDFILLDGEMKVLDHQKFFEKKVGRGNNLKLSFLTPNSTIPVTKSYRLLSLTYEKEQDISFLDKLELCISYQSTFEDEIFTFRIKLLPHQGLAH